MINCITIRNFVLHFLSRPLQKFSILFFIVRKTNTGSYDDKMLILFFFPVFSVSTWEMDLREERLEKGDYIYTKIKNEAKGNWSQVNPFLNMYRSLMFIYEILGLLLYMYVHMI